LTLEEACHFTHDMSCPEFSKDFYKHDEYVWRRLLGFLRSLVFNAGDICMGPPEEFPSFDLMRAANFSKDGA